MADSAKSFIHARIDADRGNGRWGGRVATRFPPEPNGYTHIGHAKSICLNFGLARDYSGTCNLRFDDTNPTTEDPEFVRAFERDVAWLGFTPTKVLHASDYFEQLFQFAQQLIRQGDAYVDSLDEESIRTYRGSLGQPGKPSPYRDRSAGQSLDLFDRMRAGEFPDGAHVLRARGDLGAANMKMRDPLLYRIRHAAHYRKGTEWHVYPLYDFAHCLSDAIEGITHSICTLEFGDNRELYDWILARVGIEAPPEQIEMARLELDHTVMSKRKLAQLVRQGHVAGWDDPRMPTVAGMRRRGYTPGGLRAFCDMVGVARTQSVVDLGKLEYAVRSDLNHSAPRVLCVLRPLRVVVTGFAGPARELEAPLWPHDVPKEGSRKLPYSGELFIEKSDFQIEPKKGFKRLAPGRTVRLRHADCLRCDGFETDDSGQVTLVRCTLVPDPDDKIHGVIHWVSAAGSVSCEVRLYDRLFRSPNPGATGDFLADLNPRSLVVLKDARIEPHAADLDPGAHVQFERHGYFVADTEDHTPRTRPVFNRTVELRDSWSRPRRDDPLPRRAGPKEERDRQSRGEEAPPETQRRRVPRRGASSQSRARGEAPGVDRGGPRRGRRRRAHRRRRRGRVLRGRSEHRRRSAGPGAGHDERRVARDQATSHHRAALHRPDAGRPRETHERGHHHGAGRQGRVRAPGAARRRATKRRRQPGRHRSPLPTSAHSSTR